MLETRFQLGRAAALVAGLGDVAKSFHALRDLDESAELRRPQHLAVNHVAHAMRGEEALPDVGLQLLDAQAETAVLRLDAENDCLDLLALLHNFRRMLDALRPREIRHVNQAVYSVFNLNEGAKVGEVADASLDDGPGRIALGQVLPGVVEQLLHAQRDAAIGRVHAEDDCLDFVARLDQLGGVLEPLRPGHLREVNQAFDALLQLNKRAVVGDGKNAALDVGADRVALSGVKPRVGSELLEAK